MKSWKVQIRGKSGKTESIYIDADDRSSVFKIARERSLTIISVDEVKGRRPSSNGKPAVGKGLVAGLIVAICGALALWYFLPREAPKPAPVEEKAKKPKSDLPDVKYTAPKVETPTNTVQPEVNEEAVKSTHRKGEMWYNEDGKKMITLEKDGVLTDVEVYIPKHSNLAKTSIFKHPSENQIANLLRVEPGAGVFGNRTYKGFKENFLKSLDEPIVIADDDDEWTRQLKQDVIDTKKDLKERLDAGEDIEAIMYETREELRKLAAAKRMIESESRKMLLNATSESDIEVVKQAVNALLEEKGIAPIEFNPILERRILELNGGLK